MAAPQSDRTKNNTSFLIFENFLTQTFNNKTNKPIRSLNTNISTQRLNTPKLNLPSSLHPTNRFLEFLWNNPNAWFAGTQNSTTGSYTLCFAVPQFGHNCRGIGNRFAFDEGKPVCVLCNFFPCGVLTNQSPHLCFVPIGAGCGFG